MVGLRELRNMGFIYQDEHEMATTGRRSLRAARANVKYGEGVFADVNGSIEGTEQNDDDDDEAETPATPTATTLPLPGAPAARLTTKAPKIGEVSPLVIDPAMVSPKTAKPKAAKPKAAKPGTDSDGDTAQEIGRKCDSDAGQDAEASEDYCTSQHFALPLAKKPASATTRKTPKARAKLPTPDSAASPSVKVSPISGLASPISVKGTTIAKQKAKEKADVPVHFTAPATSSDNDPACQQLSSGKLQQISTKLNDLSHRQEKPDTTGSPLVWSNSRKELCESLRYYRAYHGGGYTSDGIAHAFMFDSIAHERDYLDSTVVIARAGGGMGEDAKTGEHKQMRDQDATSQVKALENNIRTFRPVAIIAGKKLSNIQSRMEYTYQVLDWFKPTDIWCEKNNGHVAVRYRFEKLRVNEPSWWTPRDEAEEIQEVSEHLDALVPISETCKCCGKVSLQVYFNGWMCLHPKCDMFWTLPDGTAPVDCELNYDPRFLKRRTVWPHSSIPCPTRPPAPDFRDGDVAGEEQADELAELSKSLVCPKCGRCTAAKYWTYWLCGNESCAHRFTLPTPNITPAGLRLPAYPISTGFSFSEDKYDVSLITMDIAFIGNYRVHVYHLPGGPKAGWIAHFIANKTLVEEKEGPDDMFMQLNDKDIGLERRDKKDTRLAGENLCDHFTINFGYPYKFIASPDSRPFKDAPDPVHQARSRMIWCVKQMLAHPGREKEMPTFNELMVLGYKTANKIGFHDDGEEGLGPTVATLSTGAPAEMRIKMQEKHYKGVHRGEFLDDLPPIPGSIEYEKQVEAYAMLQDLKKTNEADYKTRKKSLVQELGLLNKKDENGKARTNAPEIMKLRLNHGDVVIMHGEHLQKYFLHCVEPRGRRRFAFTCREILEHHLKPEERPACGMEEDMVGWDGFALAKPQ